MEEISEEEKKERKLKTLIMRFESTLHGEQKIVFQKILKEVSEQ